jgi:hypothetical protein
VTLFAGFRCAYAHDLNEKIFVVCADSQETVDMPDGSSYRVARQKIKPRKCGNFEIAMGGSAQTGELLDACVDRIEERVAGFAGNSIPELKRFVSKELLDFGRKDAKLYSKKSRAVDCIVLARSLAGDVECWRTRAAQLVPVERKVLIGWNENLYEHVLDRLYSDVGPLLPPQQAVLLGMHILKLAEDTSNYVRGPVTVVVAHRGTIRELPSEKVKTFQERIDLFRAQVDSVLLSLADHTLRRGAYESKLDEFKATALQLRDDYVQDSAPKSVEEIMSRDDVIPDFPVGGVIYQLKVDGAPVVNENPADVAAWQKKIEFQKILGGAGPIRLTLHCKCAKSFEVESPNIQMVARREFECECGARNTATGIRMEDVRLKMAEDSAPRIVVTETDISL